MASFCGLGCDIMGRKTGLAALIAVGFWVSGCASGEPRLQGTWKSNKVPMPVEMVKVTTMETVKVRKGSRKTKRVPKTVMVAKSKSAPPYLDLVLKYERAHLTFEISAENGSVPRRVSVPYEVAASSADSVFIDVRQPVTGQKERIQISFDGPDRYWVSPVGGQGWKEYYQRIEKRG